MEKTKVLLVEDDRDVAQLTASLLESRKYQVEIAYNGTQALEKAGGIPDIILLDVTLPDMEGYDVCRRLRENERLRAFYFALAAFMGMFCYLNYGLSIILVFIGGKMLIEDFILIPVSVTLGVVSAILIISILCSIIKPQKKNS